MKKISLIKIKNVAIYTRFTKVNEKVKDYCHFTRKYRGAAHNKCNMNYKISKDIPVVFRNGSTYENHFIIK